MNADARLERDGYALVPGVLDEARQSGLAEAIETFGSAPGTRRVLEHPVIRALGVHHLGRLVTAILGDALLVRGFAIDKRLDANWALPWHRDEQIAIAERTTGGATLEGIPHTRAPRALLDRMLVARVHLDPRDADQGALLVAPGSHRDARGPDDARPSELIVAAAGDVVLMRPTLLHRSARTARGGRRRVLQLEYAPRTATPPSPWHLALAVARS